MCCESPSIPIVAGVPYKRLVLRAGARNKIGSCPVSSVFPLLNPRQNSDGVFSDSTLPGSGSLATLFDGPATYLGLRRGLEITSDHTQETRVLVEEIARALVDAPEEVFVQAVSDGQFITLQLRVAHEGKGKIIGKQGRTAGSMRTILNAIGRKTQQRFVLEILE